MEIELGIRAVVSAAGIAILILGVWHVDRTWDEEGSRAFDAAATGRGSTAPASLESDIGYRVDHHEDLAYGFTNLEVIEMEHGALDLGGAVNIRCGPTDHKPVHPTIGFRFDHDGAAVVAAGDTVPCAGLDELCDGADALVHTVIRKDIIENVPLQRLQDTLDYHSSPEEAAQTAARAGIDTLVFTHYVPPIPPGGDGADWKALAAEHFSGTVEVGDDLHQVTIEGRP